MKKFLITTLLVSLALIGSHGVASAAPTGGFDTQELPYQH
ncbi:hypothetical protein BACCIP111883_00168 [Sutcliffiella rhizosphaerae]|uniref:Uncharacterized protein n=1 Tax=Sutcliffiella rhizosphaerae TaxID=2880967 RepID=A0ABM8YI46_9BACI|nr:hypothetical protein BACCIP111883_00168 [Sutcliffiella rhizosphaerae]